MTSFDSNLAIIFDYILIFIFSQLAFKTFDFLVCVKSPYVEKIIMLLIYFLMYLILFPIDLKLLVINASYILGLAVLTLLFFICCKKMNWRIYPIHHHYFFVVDEGIRFLIVPLFALWTIYDNYNDNSLFWVK